MPKYYYSPDRFPSPPVIKSYKKKNETRKDVTPGLMFFFLYNLFLFSINFR